MFVTCSESLACAELLAAFPSAYVLQRLPRGENGLDSPSRATYEYGVLGRGVRHIVFCGHGGCWGDGGELTAEASQALVVERCHALHADERIGPMLRDERVTLQPLWFDEHEHQLYAFDVDGRPARRLEGDELTALFSRFDEMSA